MDNAWWDRFETKLRALSWAVPRDPNAAFEVQRENRLVHGVLHEDHEKNRTWFPIAFDEATLAGNPETAAVGFHRAYTTALAAHDAEAGAVALG